MDARGIDDEHLSKGAQRSSLDELAERTARADKVVAF
jgi:sulfur relay (sulfurtransferase) complex TusBCD TusD component (DsrE family)